jgi:hypothetical protein
MLGLGALLTFVLAVSLGYLLPYPASYYWLFTPVLVLLGFIFLGAGFRVAGGVYRGALAGAALYVLIAAGLATFFPFSPGIRLTPDTLMLWAWLWPVIAYAALLRLLGIR